MAGLGEALARAGKLDEAFDTAVETERIATTHLALAAQSIPERDALLFEDSLARGADLAITLASVRRDARPEWTARAWDAVIRSRSVVFDNVAQRHRRLASSEDPEILGLFEDVTKARARLARCVVRGPGDDPASYELEAKELRAELGSVEQKLVEKDEAFRLERARRLAGLDEVRAALGPGDALIGFVLYERQPARSDAKDAAQLVKESVPSYAAFVSSGGRPPALVPLGVAREIDDLVQQVREQIADVPKADGRSGRALERSYRKAASALRARVFDPLVHFLGKSRRVFIVPDGAINTIDFATLPDANGRYLIEGPMLVSISTSSRGGSSCRVRRGGGPTQRLRRLGGVAPGARTAGDGADRPGGPCSAG